MSMNGNKFPFMDKVLQWALYQILRSLMHILYRKGVAFKDFSQLSKQAYVDVVESELLSAGKRPTTTQIAAVTGLTRKDVTQLKQLSENNEMSTSFNRSRRVIQGWVNDEEYLDEQGEPRVLPFRGKHGSFEELVRRYSGDMSCFAMLDEMKRIDMVSVEKEDAVRLLNKVYIPHSDEQQKIQLLGVDVSLLINTIEHNLTARDTSDLHYQRKVSYNKIPESVLPEFRRFVNQDAQKLLVRFNSWLSARDRDSNPSATGTGRNLQAGVGMYYFESFTVTQDVDDEI